MTGYADPIHDAHDKPTDDEPGLDFIDYGGNNMTEEKPAIDWNARILELGALEKETVEALAIKAQMRRRFYQQYIKPYDDEIAALEAAAKAARASLKADAEKHYTSTGEKPEHEALTVVVTNVAMYEDAAALQWAQENERTEFIRVRKPELNKAAFKKAAPELDWAGVEMVRTARVDVSKKLQTWSIIAAFEAKQKAEAENE